MSGTRTATGLARPISQRRRRCKCNTSCMTMTHCNTFIHSTEITTALASAIGIGIWLGRWPLASLAALGTVGRRWLGNCGRYDGCTPIFGELASLKFRGVPHQCGLRHLIAKAASGSRFLESMLSFLFCLLLSLVSFCLFLLHERRIHGLSQVTRFGMAIDMINPQC